MAPNEPIVDASPLVEVKRVRSIVPRRLLWRLSFRSWRQRVWVCRDLNPLAWLRRYRIVTATCRRMDAELEDRILFGDWR